VTRETRRRRWRWLRHVAWVLSAKVSLILIAVVVFFASGAGNPLLRRLAVRRINSLTGGKAEIRSLSVQWLSWHITIKGLVIHGTEPAGTEPLFSAEEIRAGLRVDSLWGRKMSLSEIAVLRPHVHVRAEKDGKTNLPPAHRATSSSGKPLRETLFDLRVRRFELTDGWILYNDVKTPLALEGSDLRLSVDAGGSIENPLYSGQVDWKNALFTNKRFLPVPLSASARFTLWRQGLTIDQGQFGIGTSRLDLQAEMTDFTSPHWKYRYRAWVNLTDFRKTFRAPLCPAGRVDVRGEGSFAGGELKGTGSYSGSEISLSYDVFHQDGLRSTGDYTLDKSGLEIPDFVAYALGGTVKGRVTMKLPGLDFRAQTHVAGVRIAQVFPAIQHRGFPVDRLHWDSVLSADTIETWHGAFEHFQVSGRSNWIQPDQVAAGHVPVTGAWNFAYNHDARVLTLDTALFETPQGRIQASGTLGSRDSLVELHVRSEAIEEYNDLIQSIESVRAGTPEEVVPHARGAASWDGRMSGPWDSPTFAGRFRGERLSYGKFHADSADGEMVYSASEFSVSRAHLQYGAMQADLEGSLDLDHWSFRPENEWTTDVNVEKVPDRKSVV